MSGSKVEVLQKISDSLSKKKVEVYEVFSKVNRNGILECQLDTIQEFTDNATYYVSILSFETDSMLPNITNKNNKFYYSEPNSQQVKEITIFTGAFEVKDYSNYIGEIVGKYENDKLVSPIEFTIQESTGRCKVRLDPGWKIYFQNRPNTFKNELGFGDVDIDKNTISTNVIDILSTRKVYIYCDIASGSYYNGKPSNIIYSFNNTKRFGTVVAMRPNPLQEAVLINKSFSRIIFTFKDQNGEPIDFMGSDVGVTLQIRQA